jgi:hypothetical protein
VIEDPGRGIIVGGPAVVVGTARDVIARDVIARDVMEREGEAAVFAMRITQPGCAAQRVGAVRLATPDRCSRTIIPDPSRSEHVDLPPCVPTRRGRAVRASRGHACEAAGSARNGWAMIAGSCTLWHVH